MLDKFQGEFGGRIEVTAEEIGLWLEKNGYARFDGEKAHSEFTKNLGRRFVAYIKDKAGVREWFSYKTEEGLTVFAKTDEIEDLFVLEGQEKQLQKKYEGLGKSIKKVKERIYRVLNKQQTLHDYMKPEAPSSENQIQL